MKTKSNSTNYNTKMKIYTDCFAGVIRELCQQLYEAKGVIAVYDYATKTQMNYAYCKQCEADTPVISDTKMTTCALCGSEIARNTITATTQTTK